MIFIWITIDRQIGDKGSSGRTVDSIRFNIEGASPTDHGGGTLEHKARSIAATRFRLVESWGCLRNAWSMVIVVDGIK